MGLVESSLPTQAGENVYRVVFVAVVSVKKFVYGNSEIFLYQIRVRTQRHEWTFMRRFSDIVWLHRNLRIGIQGFMGKYSRPRKKVFGANNPTFIAERAVQTEKYLQALADDPVIWSSAKFREFFEISNLSLGAFYGRKGKEGYLRKCSGGYHTGFSRRAGDVFNTWRKRWIVLTDSQILYFKNRESLEPLGSLQVDPGLRSSPVGRYVRIENMTRQLVLICPSEREALEWNEAIGSFYKDKIRTQPQPFGAWFPPRPRTDVRVYTTGKNMMAAVCMALMTAQSEIMIAGWQLNPDVHLTRPPLPPIRLDHLLRYKAATGVKIYIILFKEVEMAMTNASAKAKAVLRNLSGSGNVFVMRHPNKFVGGSTALFWSHHDKVIVVDSRLAFVGGIDLAYGRWDDGFKALLDEDGVKFPGDDYYNPGSGLRPPVRPMYAPIAAAAQAIASNPKSPPLVEATAMPAAVDRTNGVTIVEGGDDESVHDDGEIESDGDEEEVEAADEKRSISRKPKTVRLTLKETEAERALREDEEQTVQVETLRQVTQLSKMKKMTSQFFVDRTESDEHETKSPSNGVNGEIAVAQPIKTANELESAYQRAFAGTSNDKTDPTQLSNYIRHPLRLTHSRMPWHDAHLCLTGPAARDVSQHFAQRWNHHRIAKGDIKLPIIMNPTDDPQFGVCAKCRAKAFEWDEQCACGNALGPVSPQFSVIKKLATSFGGDDGERTVLSVFSSKDMNLMRYECFEFEISFEDKLGIRIVGDGPAVVFSKLDPNVVLSNGRVLTTSCVDPAHSTVILEKYKDGHESLVPEVGDIVVAVGDIVVDHLPFQDVTRIVKRAQGDLISLGVIAVDFADSSSKKATFAQNIARTFSNTTDAVLSAKSYEPDRVPLHADDDKVVQLLPQKLPLRIKFRRFLRIHDEALIRLSALAQLRAKDIENMSQTNEPVEPSSPTVPDEAITQAIGFVPRVIQSDLDDLISESLVHFHEVLYSQKTALSSEEIKLEFSEFHHAEAVTVSNNDATFSSDIQILKDELLRVAASSIDIGTKIAESAIAMNVLRNITNLASSKTATSLLPDQIPFSGTCEVQILRSLGEWSGGIRVAEDSIQSAYCSLIESAEHYIYIENQFFITNTYGKSVRNRIGIMSAIERKQNFRVIVVLPLHPEGDFLHAAAVSAVMHYQYHSICRGTNSLLRRLQREAPEVDLKTYITFFSLCTHGDMDGKSVFEQVYVHDKLLIVDDKSVIIGSANINDRSMCGDRDSEIAVLVRDARTIDSMMNGTTYKAGYLPHKLRTSLWRQHVGNPLANVDDAIADSVYFDVLHYAAMANEKVLEDLNFVELKARTLIDFQRFNARRDRKEAISQDSDAEPKKKMCGNLVYFPLDFLADENLSPEYSEASILPEHLWT